jgi:hypothetical protein
VGQNAQKKQPHFYNKLANCSPWHLHAAVTALDRERFTEAPVRFHEFGTTRTNTRPKIVMPMATAAIGNKI